MSALEVASIASLQEQLRICRNDLEVATGRADVAEQELAAAEAELKAYRAAWERLGILRDAHTFDVPVNAIDNIDWQLSARLAGAS